MWNIDKLKDGKIFVPKFYSVSTKTAIPCVNAQFPPQRREHDPHSSLQVLLVGLTGKRQQHFIQTQYCMAGQK